MRKYQMSLGVFLASLILFTGFKKNPGQETIHIGNPADTKNHVDISTEPVKVSIAGTTAIQGDKGQRPVQVMVYLSGAATEPITVEYSTEDESAKAGVDYIATKGTVAFEPGEVVKWISVPIIGEVAADPDDEARVNNMPGFNIRLILARGASIAQSKAYIKILQRILKNLSILGVGSSQAIYEVKITHTGFTSFHGDNLDDCPIRRNGTVELSGLLYGPEKVGNHDDTEYSGNLEMKIDMDICSVRETGGDPPHVFCGMTVIGTGTVFTELVIYFGTDTTGAYDGRGGYIKIESKDTSTFAKSVSGDCYDQLGDERKMVPNKSIASIFNGAGLPMLTKQFLSPGTYPPHIDESGNKTVFEVLRKIR